MRVEACLPSEINVSLESNKVASIIDDKYQPDKGKQIRPLRQTLSEVLPAPDFDATAITSNGEDAWYCLRDRFLKPGPPTLANMKRMLACAELTLSHLAEDVDELELPLASVYLDAARAAQANSSVFLGRAIDLARKMPGRDGEIRNVERWSFIQVVSEAFEIALKQQSSEHAPLPLDVYYQLVFHCCHLLKIDNNKEIIRTTFKKVISFARTTEEKEKLAEAISDSLSMDYESA